MQKIITILFMTVMVSMYQSNVSGISRKQFVGFEKPQDLKNTTNLLEEESSEKTRIPETETNRWNKYGDCIIRNIECYSIGIIIIVLCCILFKLEDIIVGLIIIIVIGYYCTMVQLEFVLCVLSKN